ncbi:FAD-binding protein, partial [Spirochaetota bacterium]
MNYDCIIIGAGISGMICGIKCANEGLRTLVISGGKNALNFSSGSIDLIGYGKGQKVIPNGFSYLRHFIKSNPGHPYSKVGLKTISESLDFLKAQLKMEQLNLYNNGKKNHFHVTSMGTLKPTFISQDSVYNDKLKNAFENKTKIAVLNFNGFRDYFAQFTLDQLKK